MLTETWGGVLGKSKEDLESTTIINSKFLNPHLDDATNMQLAIAAFANNEEDGNIF